MKSFILQVLDTLKIKYTTYNKGNVTNFKIHSNIIQPDSLFHVNEKTIHFIEDAVNNGTTGFLMEEKFHRDHWPKYRDNYNKFFLIVLSEITIEKCCFLVSHYVTSHGLKIAITGSSGKTTFTRNLYNQFVKKKLGSYKFINTNIRNYNTILGLYSSISTVNNLNTLHIYEVSTCFPGTIRNKLEKSFIPDIAICLNVMDAHLINFSNHAALVDEKLSIAFHENTKILFIPTSLKKRAKEIYQNRDLQIIPLEILEDMKIDNFKNKGDYEYYLDKSINFIENFIRENFSITI